jgi:Icc-related predicted phosphoesterase
MRIAAIGDLQCEVDSVGLVTHLLDGIEDEADLLVMAGDLTNTGLPEEMEILLKELKSIPLPKIAVAGNHDHESGQIDLLTEMMESSGINFLNGTTCEINGVGFVGVKGFCGGFGDLLVKPFGEQALKIFINTTVEEALRIEEATTTLKTRHKVAILHYAPIKETIEGESPEIYPFLGTSLLADALDGHGVDVIFHGHAHNGSPHGLTPGGIPVYNVARFVRSRLGGRAYYIFDLME